MTLLHDKCAVGWTTLGRNVVNVNLTLKTLTTHLTTKVWKNFWKKLIKTGTMKSGTTSLLPKQMVPDYGKSQHENHSHSKTRLLDYHDSAHIGCNAVSQVTVSDQRFWNVLSEFPSVTKDIHFNQPCKHPFEHHILTKGRPCFARAHKVAPKYANLARQKINEMLANGVLERASGPHASPISELRETTGLSTCPLWKTHTKFHES